MPLASLKELTDKIFDLFVGEFSLGPWCPIRDFNGFFMLSDQFGFHAQYGMKLVHIIRGPSLLDLDPRLW